MCAVLMTAGSALLPSAYVQLIRSVLSVREEGLNVREVAEAAKSAYKRLRMSIIADRVLGKYGLSWDEFRESAYGRGLGELQYRIIGEIEDFRLDLEAIVAGVDSDGAHIYLIENPGELSSFDDIGYTAIGSGEYHAIRSFIENEYSIGFSLEKALYVVYEAKKYAECAPGVGEQTEMAIVDERGVSEVDQDTLAALEEIYAHKLRFMKENLKKEMQSRIDSLRKLLEGKGILSVDVG